MAIQMTGRNLTGGKIVKVARDRSLRVPARGVSRPPVSRGARHTGPACPGRSTAGRFMAPRFSWSVTHGVTMAGEMGMENPSPFLFYSQYQWSLLYDRHLSGG